MVTFGPPFWFAGRFELQPEIRPHPTSGPPMTVSSFPGWAEQRQQTQFAGPLSLVVEFVTGRSHGRASDPAVSSSSGAVAAAWIAVQAARRLCTYADEENRRGGRAPWLNTPAPWSD